MPRTRVVHDMMDDNGLLGAKDWVVITDLDGTLIDSEQTNFKVLGQLLKEFDLLGHRDSIFKGLAEGRDFEEIMTMIGITHETKRRMEERMMCLLTQVPVPSLPGASDSLRLLGDLGIIFFLVTDNYEPFATKVMRDIGLDDIFDRRSILSTDTFPFRKPSYRLVNEVLERSGRSRVIILGNTPKEVAMAREAGCPAIIITEGNWRDSTCRKETFDYEWDMYGGLDGDDVFLVKDWDEARRAIVEIIKRGGVQEGGT